ncbi:MAG: thioredoxin family protein [Chloroflexota bacterium]|nr:thioredoxin family protein [Chloroflexota bacterium]
MVRKFRALAVVLTLALLIGCGQATTGGFGDVANQPHEHTDDAAHTNQQAAASTDMQALQPVLATSELVVGPNRLALGLLENNVPIKDAAQTKVHVRYYKLNGNQATLVAEEEARYFGEGLGDRGTFIVNPAFDTAGTWGLEVVAERPGQSATNHRMSLDVQAKGNAVVVGAPAPQSKTPTERDVADLQQITSDSEPDARLYRMSVAEAVTSGKPSLILFATPGYCQTAVCGPGVDVLSKLVDTFGDKINPVHVEVYQLPYDAGKQVPAMAEWGLRTEPWLFLVDKDGKIVNRYEGGITFDELEPAVAKLIGDQS